MMKGNKGEWSELYVLVSLLADGKLNQSDIDLNYDDENVYEVVRGYKQETDYSLIFDRKDKVIKICKLQNDVEEFVTTISFNDFKELSKKLYDGIISGKGRSFGIKSTDKLLSSMSIQKLKEKSTEKSDIRLKIYDHRLAKETDLGFSIKSLIGGKSTLFNPGKGTNFIYDVISDSKVNITSFNQKTYKSINGESKITYRLKELEKLKCQVKFSDVQSNQLWRNLKMIDGDLPEVIGYALYFRWLYSTPSLKEVVNLLEEKDPLNFYNGLESEQKLYKYKVMRFLTECAMGMTTETPWLGEYDKFGGVIVAKEDGDIVAFHVYDFNLFRKYLLNNTVFEQPSTGEDKDNPGNPKLGPKVKKYYYGWVYDENDIQKIKINLQVRFK